MSLKTLKRLAPSTRCSCFKSAALSLADEGPVVLLVPLPLLRLPSAERVDLLFRVESVSAVFVFVAASAPAAAAAVAAATAVGSDRRLFGREAVDGVVRVGGQAIALLLRFEAVAVFTR